MDPLALGTQYSLRQAAARRLSQLEAQYQNPESKDQKKLKQAAQEFEAIFVKQMLDAMEKTVDRSNSILSGGSAEEYFRSMLNDHVARNISTGPGGSGFGLAEAIYRDMSGLLGKEAPLAPKQQLSMPDEAGAEGKE